MDDSTSPSPRVMRCSPLRSQKLADVQLRLMKLNHKIRSLEVLDIRYPTARMGMAGSDPRHLAPKYSCAVTILRTDSGLEGRSLVFTAGDGTQIQKVAIEALQRFVVGRDFCDFVEEPGLFAQALMEHHQLRWLA